MKVDRPSRTAEGIAAANRSRNCRAFQAARGLLSAFASPFLQVLIAAVFLTCCTETPIDDRRILVFGAETDLHGFDVIRNGGRMIPATALAASLILEPLLRRDAEGRLVPVLGLEAHPSEDGKSWAVSLRQDVIFHDGTPFNADAVVAHWRRLLDPNSGFRGRPFIEPIAEIFRIDEHTVRFHLTHPWPAFLGSLCDPHSSIALIPSPAAVQDDHQHTRPVGTGPFRFTAWAPDSHFVVGRNPDYRHPETVHLDVILIRPLPDHDSRYASLVTGQADLITMDQGSYVRKAEADPSLKVIACDQNGAEIILLNTSKPPLDDVKVRLALALGNDQRCHVALAYQGTTFTVDTILGSRFSCDRPSYPEYDPDEARRLLAARGCLETLELIHSNMSRGSKTGEIMQQLCKEIGATLRLHSADAAQHVMRVTTGDFQMATWRFIAGSDPGRALMAGFRSGSARNFGAYSNPTPDRLLEEQENETDRLMRKKILCEAAAVLNSEAPVLLRGGLQFYLLAGKSVRRLDAVIEGVPNLASVRVKHERATSRQRQMQVAGLLAPKSYHDPGQVDPDLAGVYRGEDTRNGQLTFTFDHLGTVIAQRHGRRDPSPQKGTFVMQGVDVQGKFGGIRFKAVLIQNSLKGSWELGNGYGADFVLKKSDENKIE